MGPIDCKPLRHVSPCIRLGKLVDLHSRREDLRSGLSREKREKDMGREREGEKRREREESLSFYGRRQETIKTRRVLQTRSLPIYRTERRNKQQVQLPLVYDSL